MQSKVNAFFFSESIVLTMLRVSPEIIMAAQQNRASTHTVGSQVEATMGRLTAIQYQSRAMF